jgi:hypothetical protein
LYVAWCTCVHVGVTKASSQAVRPCHGLCLGLWFRP